MFQDKMTSTLVTYINLFAKQNSAKQQREDVLSEIISDISLENTKEKKKRYITKGQVKQALLFPYSNFKSVIISKIDYFNKLNHLSEEKKLCSRLLKKVEYSEKELATLKEKCNEEEIEHLQKQEDDLAENKEKLKEQLSKIKEFREKMEKWHSEFENKMEEHREKWIQLREQLGKQSIEALEKNINIKLTETEAKQLYEIESLDSIYKRYETLGIKPPIPYEKALKDPKSLIILKTYIVGREVKNRERIN